MQTHGRNMLCDLEAASLERCSNSTTLQLRLCLANMASNAPKPDKTVVLTRRSINRSLHQFSVVCEWQNRPDGVLAAVYKDGFIPDSEAIKYVTMEVSRETPAAPTIQEHAPTPADVACLKTSKSLH
jgi:hypothetical protein